MKTNGMGKRILIFTLTAVIVLTMQGPRVFAESLQPESQSETSAEQPENQTETTEGRSVNQNDLTEEEQEIQPEITEEETVSQNDLPEEEQDSQPATTTEESVSGNDLAVLQSEDQPVVEEDQIDAAAYPELTKEILDKCIIPGMDPPGVTINLFDYWQKENNPSPEKEIAHDQDRDWDWNPGELLTYNLGISEGHLLRFGYTNKWYNAEKSKFDGCDTCIENGFFGEWNNSMPDVPYQGIVKNILGPYGDPVLNLDTKEDFGGYAKIGDKDEREKYLSKKNESLNYLFSTDVRLPDYKTSYMDVGGLFQPDGDGYYYYSSTKNFASYNEDTNSFILYNSPGVATYSFNAYTTGEFFPFNKAEEVFDTYTIDANGKYHLRYVDRKQKGNVDQDYKPVQLLNDSNTYLYCFADRLNHYLGMTMEFLFRQPENGSLSNGKPMTFEFTGDDDVWIFIDNVLVADLGGLHSPCSLDIDFSTGIVTVEGNQHTLLKSFQDAYGEHSDLGGVAFRDNTFADNTDHTLKMFYLERGHGASDLDLRFNIQTVAYEPDKETPPNVPNEDSGETDGTVETEEPTPDSAAENIISRSDDHVTLNTTEIPRTGDDSRIGWLIALCFISLSGIGAAVCKIIFVRRKQENHSSKQ